MRFKFEICSPLISEQDGDKDLEKGGYTKFKLNNKTKTIRVSKKSIKFNIASKRNLNLKQNEEKDPNYNGKISKYLSKNNYWLRKKEAITKKN